MRLLSNLLSLSLLAATTAATFPAQELLQSNKHRIPPYPNPGHLPVIMSPSSSSNNQAESQVQPAVFLVDILGTQRSLTTFFSLSRMRPETSDPLADPHAKTTVLAPSNVAIEDLPRKPWENPGDYDALGSQAYDGSGGKERADENMMRFVQAHLVVGQDASRPWEAGVKAKTAAGREIWWEEGGNSGGDGEGRRVIMPDRVEVERVASRVANGEVWILKGVLNYA
ncbi:hypothetical protein HDV57DRAFT_188696 [Trichoderma longibrachiatum]